MIEKMKAFCKNHREIIDYMLVGCGTTVAAWGSKYLCNLLFFDGTAFPTLAQNTVLSLVENTAAIEVYRLAHDRVDSRLAAEHAAGQRPGGQCFPFHCDCRRCGRECEFSSPETGDLPPEKSKAERQSGRGTCHRACECV